MGVRPNTLLLATAVVLLAPSPARAEMGPRNTLLQGQSDSRFDLSEPGYFITGFESNEPGTFTENDQVRFHIPIRYRLMALESLVGGVPEDTAVHLYADYTQDSFWNLWDESAPFYDSTFMPGAYLYANALGLPFGAAAGVLHQSNGRDGELSRSWNRYYGAVSVNNPRANAVFGTVTIWGTWGVSDTNEDITDKMGRGEIDLYFVPGALDRPTIVGGDRVSLQLRTAIAGEKVFQNVEISLLLRVWKEADAFASSFFVQYWSGTGLILRDYDQDLTQWRFGLAMVPEWAFHMK